MSHTAPSCFIGITALHGLVATTSLKGFLTFELFQGLTMAPGGRISWPWRRWRGCVAARFHLVSTLGAAPLGTVIGHLFNGTTQPLALGALGCGCSP